VFKQCFSYLRATVVTECCHLSLFCSCSVLRCYLMFSGNEANRLALCRCHFERSATFGFNGISVNFILYSGVYLSISFCIQRCICQFHSVLRGVSVNFILYSGVYLSISFCIQGCSCQFHSVFRGVSVNFILYSEMYLSISFCIQGCICQFHSVFRDVSVNFILYSVT